MRRGGRAADESAKVRAQFQKLDRNRDGTLSFREVKGMLKSLNPSFSEHQLQKLFCEMDADQNGKIDQNEFFDFIMDNKKKAPSVAREPPRSTPSAPDVRPKWKEATLDAHNHLRRVHGTPPLEWSDECYVEAKKQADACQEKSQLFHGYLQGPSGRHGQNGYWCSAPGSSAQQCVQSWYDEITDPGYDFNEPGFTSGTGHFTQVVWRDTRQVGMALSEDGKFVFANYYPAGNFQGRFEQNVPQGTWTPGGGGGAAPERREQSPSPQRGGRSPAARKGGAAGAIADAMRAAEEEGEGEEEEDGDSSEVTAKKMTPAMKRMFEGCPFPFEQRAEQGFSKGATVTAKREQNGPMTSLILTVKEGGCTSTATGRWGGG